MAKKDSEGRDTRIHGLVLDGAHPERTMRELLRQWVESGQDGSPELVARTELVLQLTDTDGRVL